MAASSGQEPGFLETIDVRVVNVETVVTDRQGIRVPDLRADDFRLWVDGVETPISFFSEVRGGDAIAGGGEVSEWPSVVPGEPVGTSYLVFVDEFFTVAADRRRVLRQFADELAFLGPEDRMALVAWNGSGLEMLTSWSQSPRQLAQALRVAQERPSGGLERLVELRSYESDRRVLRAHRTRFGGAFGESTLSPEERAYLNRLSRQLENGVAAATATLRGFANPPGRKVAIMLTGTWPDRPSDYALAEPLRAYLGPADERDLYAPLIETANLLGYTLYPVDVAGIEADGTASASVRWVPGQTGHHKDRYRERTVHYGLEQIAWQTGGEPLLNGQRNRPFERVAGDTRSFYWLGFTPDRQGDGAAHEIRLEVLVPGLDARTRSGFVDLSRGQEVTLATESALLFGHLAGAEALEVELGPSRKAGWGRVEVPLTVTVPLDELTLLAADREWVGELELRVAARDARGNRADVAVIPISVSRESAPGTGDLWTFETTLAMRRRDHDMVVALYDKASGELFASSTSYSHH
jgi:VWFA-related protein